MGPAFGLRPPGIAMTQRPQNCCKRCQYTWFPRGKNVSRKCPHCGSTEVDLVPLPPLAPAAMGCVGILLLFAVIGAIFSGHNENTTSNSIPTDEDGARPVAREKQTTGDRQPRERVRPALVTPFTPTERNTDPPKRSTPFPSEQESDPVTPPIAVAPPLPVAPPPRVLLPFPIPANGYKSAWQKIGRVEARVAGAVVGRVPIIDGNNSPSESPTAVLAVWVEVRTESSVRPVVLRRWQDAIGESCSLTYKGGRPIPRANLGPGASLRTGLPYSQMVPPDGTPVFGVVAFTVPDGSRDLRLALDAERVGEVGTFLFSIPVSARRH